MSILAQHHNLLSGMFAILVALIVPHNELSVITGIFGGLSLGFWLSQEILERCQ